VYRSQEVPHVSTSLFDLSGRVALITGSGQGIGLVLARGLADAGATIVLSDVVADRVESAAEQCRKDGLQASRVAFDVTGPAQGAAAVEKIETEVGPIEILVNNAGIQIRHPLEEFPVEQFDKLMAINVKGVFVCSQAVARKMIARGHGKIISIGSMQSELARPTIAPYTASKGAVKNLIKGMATEWGKYNIQSNGIGPGYFASEMTKALVEDPVFDSWLKNRTPAHRWGDQKELVGAAVFLASDASSFVNGHMLYVDGGMLACV
jgi:gluconate 5-dehydrogenase